MDAIDVLTNISNTKLIYANNLRYCLVGSDKVPYTVDGKNAKPNSNDDFVPFADLLEVENLGDYAGVGISIKASNVCAIDVDHCFETKFDFSSIDERGKYIYEKFKDLAYIEFSFSGTGMRVIFIQEPIENYNDYYYVKNSGTNIEFYQPSGSARYVTVTGMVISNNSIKSDTDFRSVIIEFLDKYMVRPKINREKPKTTDLNKDKSFKDLMIITRMKLLKDYNFQTLWFDRREWLIGKQYQGTGESEHDFALLQYIYNNITQDMNMCKAIFEESKFFKTKDAKHKQKWNYQDYRYFYYIFKQL